jgi:hypothetical protein
MLDDALIELVKDVGADGAIYVRVRQALPERVVDGLNPRIRTRLRVYCGPLIERVQRCEDGFEIPEREVSVLPQLVPGDIAGWALARFHSSDEDLLRIIPYESSIDRMPAACNTIATGHRNASLTGLLQRSKNMCHARVKYVAEDASACGFVFDVFHARGGKVTEEDITATGGFPADLFGNITDSHVHRICCFVAENGELGFIGGYDDGNNCRAGIVLLNGFL